MTPHPAPEAGAGPWRTSSYSGGGNNCVEVAQVNGLTAIRDSKNPRGGQLSFGPAAWRAFIRSVKDGASRHDLNDRRIGT